ncbi:MAG: hypothetical protein JWN38_248 [Candidatus Saccharibacteria bacterium]|nr:hypothetical protein [Candidatus Saccharibacteria bacterium]
MAATEGTTKSKIKIVNSALDDHEGDIVLRGIIDPNCLPQLLYAKYQREMLSAAKIKALVEAHRAGDRVPDIELGMRGHKYQERKVGGKDVVYLEDEVYVVDGQQRVRSAIQLMQLEPQARPHIGVVVHFGTNEPWERARFKVLNLGQTKLSSNVTLRNLAEDLEVMKAILSLTTNNKTFVMNGRVCWNQSMIRGQLMTAVAFDRIVGMLHSHAGSGLSTDAVELAHNLQKIMENVGKPVFLANIRTYFDIVDRCYGVQNVQYKAGANQLKLTFSLALAKLFSQHLNFWKQDRLEVDETTIKKLAGFAIYDPQVTNLSSSSGMAGNMLFQLLVEHVNSGRRTGRLKPRSYTEPLVLEDESSSLDGED